MENNRKHITLEGESFPLLDNLDALCLFEDITGKDYTRISLTSVRDASALLYCMAKAGARRTDRPFPWSLEQFRSMADPEMLRRWMEGPQAGAAPGAGEADGEKKRR